MGSIADIAYQRGDYDEALRIHREVSCRSSSGSATPGPPPSPGARSRTSPTSGGTTTRRCGSAARWSCRSTSGSVTPGPPPSPGARSPTSPTERGDYDEALRIRREVELPVYERLGDAREAAVTWGKIADIAYQRGDYDEALRIRREVELPVYRAAR